MPRLDDQRQTSPPAGFLTDLYRKHVADLRPLRRFRHQREFEADWIRSMRKRHKRTQSKLAEDMNVSPQAVQNWENPVSRKWVATNNQENLRRLDRRLCVDRDIVVLGEMPVELEALLKLIRHHEDDTARALGAALVNRLSAGDPQRPLVHHVLYIVNRLSGDTAKAREHVTLALIEVAPEQKTLRGLLENAQIGLAWADLQATSMGAAREAKGRMLLSPCVKLHQSQGLPLYLWNALEIACLTPLPQAEIKNVLEALIQSIGREAVLAEIRASRQYEPARKLI